MFAEIQDGFSRTYPSLFEVINCTSFQRDLNAFLQSADLQNVKITFEQLKKTRNIKAKRLLGSLLGGICDLLFTYDVHDLERDLRELTLRFDIPTLRQAFSDKLLDDRYDNTLTEIAAATVVCEVFDNGSVHFEERLPGSWKNPDMTGTWAGHKAVAEVTCVNIEYPPRTPADLEDEIKTASFSAGFNVWLRSPIIFIERAKRIRVLLEKLFTSRGGLENVITVDGFPFEREDHDSFRCDDAACLVQYVEFYLDLSESRSVQQGVFSVSMMSERDRSYLEERYPTPKQVIPIQFGNGEDAFAHRRNTFFLAIRDMITGKLSQCSPQAINVIILGVANPMFDLDVQNALYGSYYVTLEHRPTAADGVTLADPAPSRVPGGIFRLITESVAELSEDERPHAEEYVHFYSDISGVLLFRTGANMPDAQFFPNHNATSPLSTQQADTLVETARRRCNRRALAKAEA